MYLSPSLQPDQRLCLCSPVAGVRVSKGTQPAASYFCSELESESAVGSWPQFLSLARQTSKARTGPAGSMSPQGHGVATAGQTGGPAGGARPEPGLPREDISGVSKGRAGHRRGCPAGPAARPGAIGCAARRRGVPGRKGGGRSAGVGVRQAGAVAGTGRTGGISESSPSRSTLGHAATASSGALATNLAVCQPNCPEHAVERRWPVKSLQQACDGRGSLLQSAVSWLFRMLLRQ